jgi:glycine betaine/proline transport system substrate-binding protein
MWNKLFLGVLLLASLICYSFFSGKEQKTLEVVYFECDSSIIISEIAKNLLEDRLGYQVNMTLATPAAGWASIATGMADACLSVWLPVTQEAFYENLKNRVEVVNQSSKGAKIGLAVPSYVNCQSMKELKEIASHFDYKIYGIEPGAGLMLRLELAQKKYGLDQYEIIEGTEALMLSSLRQAKKESKWILVTAWSPHSIFKEEDLKYLDDPEHTFGTEEYIATICRKSLGQDAPEVYQFLRQFTIQASEVEEMEFLMRTGNASPKDLAQEWINKHPKEIADWF